MPDGAQLDELEHLAQVRAEVAAVMECFEQGCGLTIPALQAVQDEMGYVPPEAFDLIAERLGRSEASVRGVATFYTQFKLREPAKHNVKVCAGTACHVKGAQLVLDEWEKELGIAEGEKTEDGEFDLEKVACVGCCSVAPVVIIDDTVIGNTSSAEVKRLAERTKNGTLGVDEGQKALSSTLADPTAGYGMGGSSLSFIDPPASRTPSGGLGFEIL